MLSTINFSLDGKLDVGIQHLLKDKTFETVYTLHDGQHETEQKSVRQILNTKWAKAKVIRNQPLWLIQWYFGPKFAFYFAWLEFYTKCLIVPAIVGVLCVLYSSSSVLDSELNPISHAICSSQESNMTMCPACAKKCDFSKLEDLCFLSKVKYVNISNFSHHKYKYLYILLYMFSSYLADNEVNILFGVFMSFWSCVFLCLWRQQQAIHQWEWDMTKDDTVDEAMAFDHAPDRKMKREHLRSNPRDRAWRYTIIAVAIFLMMSMMITALACVILVKVYVVEFFYNNFKISNLFSEVKLIGALASAGLNFILISTLELIYPRMAHYLTKLENTRTENEYERSYSFKLFLFQLINYFTSLTYTAFFKGRFYTYPGDVDARQSIFTLVRTDKCDIGCSYEVAALLTLLMCGKQTLSFISYCLPKLELKWKSYQRLKRTHVEENTDPSMQRCEADYFLRDITSLHLHDEYIEIGIQFALVTLFVNMFPLAPLLALVSNLVELRLDARKYIKFCRRPLTRRVRDIGAWMDILQLLSYLSIVTNAFVISFTSSFVPRMVYKYLYAEDGSMKGFLYWQMIRFDTSVWGNVEDGNYYGPSAGHNQTFCFYNSPSMSSGNEAWWVVLMARMTFVIVFEHFVFLISKTMASIIPTCPPSLATQITREKMNRKDRKFTDAKNKQELIRQARLESFYNYTCST